MPTLLNRLLLFWLLAMKVDIPSMHYYQYPSHLGKQMSPTYVFINVYCLRVCKKHDIFVYIR